MEQAEYITVGRFGRTRGVDGELYVQPLTDFPERFATMKAVHVSVKGEWNRFDIESVEMLNGRPVIKLQSVDSLEQATAFANCELGITREELMPLAPGQHYVFELVGCAVVDATSDELIGTITNVERYPANDAYMIRSEAGEEWVCPAVSAFVHEVDISARRVKVARSGLLQTGPTK